MTGEGPQGFSQDIIAMQEAIVSKLTAERDALRDALRALADSVSKEWWPDIDKHAEAARALLDSL